MRTGLKSSRGHVNRRRPRGLSPVEDVSFIETHANTKGYIRAKDYDPEQHIFPQRKTNTPLSGAQLGSTKSLEFGKDENGEFLLQVDVAGSYISSDSLPNLSAKNLFVWAWGIRSANGATSQITGQWGSAGSKAVRIIESAAGALQFQYSTDGTTVVIPSILSAEPSWWTDAVSPGWIGAFYNHSAGEVVWYDGGTGAVPSWSVLETDVIGVITISDESAGTPISIGCDDTPGGARWTTKIYAAGVGSSTTSLDDYGRWDASLFKKGNRGHGSIATDAQGNTWTINRAGSPLSVIDTRDGNGKRVRFKGTSANSIRSSTKPTLTGGEVVTITAKMAAADWNADQFVCADFRPTGNQRSWGFRRRSSGVLRLSVSSDGTAVSHFDGNGSAFQSALTDDAVGWLRMVWTVGTDVEFYVSTDGTTFTQFGTAVTCTTIPFAGSGLLELGSAADGTSEIMVGDLFDVTVDVDGTNSNHFDAALINRYKWRLDNIVESDVDGEAWQVVYTDSAEDANDPVVLWHYGEDYAYMTGSTSNTLSSPTTQAVADGSVLSLRANVSLTDWSPSAINRIIDGQLYLMVNTSGGIRYGFNGVSTFPTANSSIAIPVLDNMDLQIRADHTPSADTVDFLYRFGTTDLSDDTGWSTLGTQQSITDEAFDVLITGGTFTQYFGGGSSSQPLSGKGYRALIKDDDTVIWNIDISDAPADGTSFTDSVTSNTVTINRSQDAFATSIVKFPKWLHGDSHYLSIPHHASMDADPVSVFANLILHSENNGWKPIITKKNDIAAITAGYMMQRHNTNERVYINEGDGTLSSDVGALSTGFSHSTRHTVAGVFSPTDQEYYLDGVSKDSATPALSALTNTEDFVIGADGARFSTLGVGEMMAVAILDSRVSDTEALEIHNELALV